MTNLYHQVSEDTFMDFIQKVIHERIALVSASKDCIKIILRTSKDIIGYSERITEEETIYYIRDKEFISYGLKNIESNLKIILSKLNKILKDTL